MLRIAICDDNPDALQKTAKIVNECLLKYKRSCDITSFDKGKALIDAHNQERFDVIFLDIDMPQFSGFDVAQNLRDNFCSSFIVFVTNHSELVYESFDFQPFHFIQKNEYNENFRRNMSQVIKKLVFHMRQNDKIILEDENKRKHAILIRDIIYLESNRHYIKYHTVRKDLTFRVRGSMKSEEEKYSAYDFVRIHKQFLVNMRYIKDLSIGKEEIVLDVDRKIPRLSLSRNYKGEAENKYMMYLRTKT